MSIKLKDQNQIGNDFPHFSIKTTEEVEKQTNNSTQEVDSRFLQIENYMDFQSKSKVVFSKYFQFQYYDRIVLISKAFNFSLQSFSSQNTKIASEDLYQTLSSMSNNQSPESLLSYNRNKEFMRSFTGFTRKSNNIIFLLVEHYKEGNKIEKESYVHKIKLIFLNYEGKVLHVCSNLDFQCLEKVRKIIKKHFTRLDLILVINRSSNIQQATKLFNEVYEQKSKIILITEVDRNRVAQAKIALNRSEEVIGKITELNRAFSVSNNSLLISHSHHQSVQNLQPLIAKAFQISLTHQFIVTKLLKIDILPLQILFTNQFINSVIPLYFNLITLLTKDFLFDFNSINITQQLNHKIAQLFIASINKFQHSNILNHPQKLSPTSHHYCFPHLFQTSKRCLVCKQSKPKYGCLTCTNKFKTQIHLCVNQCFKIFHTETIKYVSSKIPSSHLPSQLQKQKSFNVNPSNNILTADKQEKNIEVNPVHDSLLSIRRNKHKMIKKKIKGIQKTDSVFPSTQKSMRIYPLLTFRQSNKTFPQ